MRENAFELFKPYLHVLVDIRGFSSNNKKLSLNKVEVPFGSWKTAHTSPGKCWPLCCATANFSFEFCIWYQDKMIPYFVPYFVNIFEGGSMITGTQKGLQNLNVNFNLI